MLLQFPAPNNNEIDLKQKYDAVVVGSGAAGGMAAHVLTTHGMKVLLLEAGKNQDTGKILHSMEWPYDHPRRGKMPPDYHALTANEYTFRQSPYAQGSAVTRKSLRTYRDGAAPITARRWWWMRKSNPYTGTQLRLGAARARSAARPPSGAAWRCACPITISKPRPAMAMARIGRFPTPTSSLTTTASICTLASPGIKENLPLTSRWQVSAAR